ncbi:hypothetical protein QP028_05015 [Corynebacterium suedekumii]|nr:hypothetical protein QP028_05015 [Corynebacterium suedekumii]
MNSPAALHRGLEQTRGEARSDEQGEDHGHRGMDAAGVATGLPGLLGLRLRVEDGLPVRLDLRLDDRRVHEVLLGHRADEEVGDETDGQHTRHDVEAELVEILALEATGGL